MTLLSSPLKITRLKDNHSLETGEGDIPLAWRGSHISRSCPRRIFAVWILVKIWRVLPHCFQWILGWLLNAPFLVGVIGVVVNDQGQVLVLDHSYRREQNWGLPSGWLKSGEWIQAALFREIMEETGLLVDVGPLLAVSSALTSKRVDVVYLCRVRGGTPRINHEILEMRFCEPDDLPEAMYASQRAAVLLAKTYHPHWFEEAGEYDEA